MKYPFRTTILCSLPLILAGTLGAQTIASSVLGNGASAASGGNIQLNATIGQSATGRVGSGSANARQGFWYRLPVVPPVVSVREDYTGTTTGSATLSQNYPNPFSTGTTLQIGLASDCPVTLTVYDALGRPVRTLIEGPRHAGTITLNFTAGDLPNGIYTARLRAGQTGRTVRMIIAK